MCDGGGNEMIVVLLLCDRLLGYFQWYFDQWSEAKKEECIIMSN